MTISDSAKSTPYVIALIGGSGSGKSTLLRRISEEYSADQVAILNMDDYYHPREKQYQDLNGVRNFDLPSALDHLKFVADLERLIEGKSLSIKEYTFNNEQAVAASKACNPAPIIVIEGLYLLEYSELEHLIDYSIFISAPDVIRLIRRIRRDREERNYPLDDVLYRFEHHVLPSHEIHIEKHAHNCDLIVRTDDSSSDPMIPIREVINLKLATLESA